MIDASKSRFLARERETCVERLSEDKCYNRLQESVRNHQIKVLMGVFGVDKRRTCCRDSRLGSLNQEASQPPPLLLLLVSAASVITGIPFSPSCPALFPPSSLLPFSFSLPLMHSLTHLSRADQVRESASTFLPLLATCVLSCPFIHQRIGLSCERISDSG